MSDIAVVSTGYTGEKRSWLASPHGCGPGENPNVTLDISKFTVVGGVIPSGTVLGKVTASGKYGPYDDALVNGQEVATGILFGSVPVASGQTQAAASIMVHGFVYEAKLTGINAAGKTDLKLVHFG